jgi:hypothetical protein
MFRVTMTAAAAWHWLTFALISSFHPSSKGIIRWLPMFAAMIDVAVGRVSQQQWKKKTDSSAVWKSLRGGENSSDRNEMGDWKGETKEGVDRIPVGCVEFQWRHPFARDWSMQPLAFSSPLSNSCQLVTTKRFSSTSFVLIVLLSFADHSVNITSSSSAQKTRSVHQILAATSYRHSSLT